MPPRRVRGQPFHPIYAPPVGHSGYWLDSVDVLEVILACEREFGTVFEEGADLAPEALSSARRLADLVRSKFSA